MLMKALTLAVPAYLLSLAAFAAPTSVPTGNGSLNGLQFNAGASWTLSASVLEGLDVARVEFKPYGNLTEFSVVNPQGFYESVRFTAPATSLKLEANGMAFLGANSTGGITMTAPVQRSVSSGGTLTVTDLAIDVPTKRVLATFIGANGVGTRQNVHFLNYANLSGDSVLATAGTFQNQLNVMTITPEAFDILVQGLGLLTLGRGALASIEDFGVISNRITAVATAPAIPEPSTWALMSLGLVAVAWVGRRSKATAA
jgi:hypothetical protein